MNDIERPESVRELARGIAVRAGILSVAGLIVGTMLFSAAAKLASGAVKVMTGAILIAAGTGFAAWEVKKAKRRFAARTV